MYIINLYGLQKISTYGRIIYFYLPKKKERKKYCQILDHYKNNLLYGTVLPFIKVSKILSQGVSKFVVQI